MPSIQRAWTHALRPQRHVWLLVLVAASIAIAWIAASYCHSSGDTKGTLLVSQEIVRHGSVRLDRYDEAELRRLGYPLSHKNGHLYDFFPLGTPLLSTPFVAVANVFGLDVYDRHHDDAVQLTIAATVVVALLWLLFAMARLFLDPWPAAGLAVVCVFGTTLVSTGLSSLFSHDFATLAATVAIYLTVRAVRKGERVRVILVGGCLFLAYLCRPTMSLLAPFLLLYLFLYRHLAAVQCGAVLAGLLAGFALWSQHEYGQWLPTYYLPQRLAPTDFATAAWQDLFGPSRGLFVFSPFLALVPLLALPLALVRRERDDLCMLLVGLAWPIAHWLAVARFPHWWAGWSFGPRLMFDCLPGLFLALFHSLHRLRRSRAWVYALIGVLGAFSIYVNVHQAFVNPYPMRWNAEPNVDEYPEYVSDWRYPQFLHDAERHRRRLEEFKRILELPGDSPDALFGGFSAARDGVRWNTAGAATVRLPLPPGNLPEGRLLVAGHLNGDHALRIVLNGHLVHEGRHVGGRMRLPITFDPTWFVAGDNVLAFEVTDAPGTPNLFGLASLSVFPRP